MASVTLPISYDADTAKVLDLIDLAVSEYARQHPDPDRGDAAGGWG